MKNPTSHFSLTSAAWHATPCLAHCSFKNEELLNNCSLSWLQSHTLLLDYFPVSQKSIFSDKCKWNTHCGAVGSQENINTAAPVCCESGIFQLSTVFLCYLLVFLCYLLVFLCYLCVFLKVICLGVSHVFPPVISITRLLWACIILLTVVLYSYSHNNTHRFDESTFESFLTVCWTSKKVNGHTLQTLHFLFHRISFYCRTREQQNMTE